MGQLFSSGCKDADTITKRLHISNILHRQVSKQDLVGSLSCFRIAPSCSEKKLVSQKVTQLIGITGNEARCTRIYDLIQPDKYF